MRTCSIEVNQKSVAAPRDLRVTLGAVATVLFLFCNLIPGSDTAARTGPRISATANMPGGTGPYGPTDSHQQEAGLVNGLAADACGTPFIANIESFLDTCPASDPATEVIRSDFQIRRNGVLVEDIPCGEPISQLTVAQYTDELIVLQGLRVIYYMDRGKQGHLPWTPGSLYDWMKSKFKGIDIRDGSGSFCCENFDGKLHIAVGAQDDFNRDFDRKWEGISGNIDLYAHETRHVDGFFHTSCCKIPSGCDQTYDENNLSAYAIQWWLEKSWLMGDINVGFSCLSASRIQEIVNWHLSAANSQFRDRFCDQKPPLLAVPQVPGGHCAATVPDFALTLSPATQTVAPGESASLTIEVGAVESQSPDTVRLCATVAPPDGGGTIAISPDSVSPGSTALLTFSTPSDAVPGDYLISLGGTAGLHAHTRTATVVVMATVTGPLITGAEVRGKKLFVYGRNFDDGAKIFLNENKQKTKNDGENPSTVLIGKKAGKKIEPGETVTLQVRNGDQMWSNQFSYSRPLD